MNNNGGQTRIVFILCQPRSGSSMLQQIILSSGEVYSSPEPWFMLPLSYIYKYPGVHAVYNSRFANICFRDYLANNEKGFDEFLIYLREFAYNLYKIGSKRSGKKIILDKTPRYYHISEELLEIFPDAKIIALVRNPVSVFASILNYNFRGNYLDMMSSSDRIDDLVQAPRKIAKLKKDSDQRVLIVKYENIVEQAKNEISKLYKFLNLKENLVRKGSYTINENFINTRSIDTKSVHNHNVPVVDYLDSWRDSIDTYQKKKLLLGYLKYLGESLVTEIGYDYNSIIDNVKNHKTKMSLFRYNFEYFVNRYSDVNSN